MDKNKRKSLNQKTRFEVFKRDSFTCQYCGRKAPEVTLQVDHIKPRSKGGTDDILNLITSCFDCNSGKSNNELSSHQEIEKKRSQLEQLQERKEQIEMMFNWQKELSNIDDYTVEKINDLWKEKTNGYWLTEAGKNKVKNLIRKYPLDEVIEAINISARTYLKYHEGKITKESATHALKKIEGICRTKKAEKTNPYLQNMYYIRGILKNQLHYFNEGAMFAILNRAKNIEADEYLPNMTTEDIFDWITETSKEANNWTEWKTKVEDYLDAMECYATDNKQGQIG